MALLGEPDIWQSFAGPDQSGQWRCTIARGIRRFRGISTIEDYWRSEISLVLDLPYHILQMMFPLTQITYQKYSKKCFQLNYNTDGMLAQL